MHFEYCQQTCAFKELSTKQKRLFTKPWISSELYGAIRYKKDFTIPVSKVEIKNKKNPKKYGKHCD